MKIKQIKRRTTKVIKGSSIKERLLTEPRCAAATMSNHGFTVVQAVVKVKLAAKVP